MAAGDPGHKAKVLPIRGAPSPPKLLDRVRQAIRMRHYSRRTESAYVHWIRRFIIFHGKKHPDHMGASEVTSFLSWLATSQRVSASTPNQALSAILFLYKHVLQKDLGRLEPVARAKTPHRVPVVLSRDEVSRILRHLTGRMWVIVGLLYGSGLRLQECLELRVKDVDFDLREIVVRRGKGQKDRRTMLPSAVEGAVRAHLQEVKRQHEQDRADGYGRVALPFALDRGMLRLSGRGSSSSPPAASAGIPVGGRHRASNCTRQSSSGRSDGRAEGGADEESWRPHVGIRSRRSCCRRGTTFGPCRSSSATRTSARQ